MYVKYVILIYRGFGFCGEVNSHKTLFASINYILVNLKLTLSIV